MTRATTGTVQIAAKLAAELVAEIDRSAVEDVRSRSAQLAWLARIGLAGRERLKEFERAAAVPLVAVPSKATEAAREHLRRHAELSGFPPPDKPPETGDG